MALDFLGKKEKMNTFFKAFGAILKSYFRILLIIVIFVLSLNSMEYQDNQITCSLFEIARTLRTCPCGITVQSYKDFIKHIKQKHASSCDQKFNCPDWLCKVRTYFPELLILHFIKHIEEIKMCSLCFHSFAQYNHNHFELHEKYEKAFQYLANYNFKMIPDIDGLLSCPKCIRRYYRHAELLKHMDIHINENIASTGKINLSNCYEIDQKKAHLIKITYDQIVSMIIEFSQSTDQSLIYGYELMLNESTEPGISTIPPLNTLDSKTNDTKEIIFISEEISDIKSETSGLEDFIEDETLDSLPLGPSDNTINDSKEITVLSEQISDILNSQTSSTVDSIDNDTDVKNKNRKQIQKIFEIISKCECSEEFINYYSFLAHLEDAHLCRNHNLYLCLWPNCFFITDVPNFLIMHSVLHTKQNLRFCSACRYKISSKTAYKHYALHENYKKEFAYLQKKEVKIIFENDGRLKCFCGDTFRYLKPLLEHQKMHMEAEKFEYLSDSYEVKPKMIRISYEQILDILDREILKSLTNKLITKSIAPPIEVYEPYRFPGCLDN